MLRIYFRKAVYLVVLIGFTFANAGSYEDFFLAVNRDKVLEVRALLARGFDPNTVNPNGASGLFLAISEESWGVAKLLASHPLSQVDARNANDETPLMLSALKGNLELCELLISRDADLNKKGWAPLHYAATNGNPALVRLMLDHYAYIDAESPNGSTPLMMAAMYGSIDSVKVLLDAGADPSVKNKRGLSALDFAQRAASQVVVDLIAAHIRSNKEPGNW